MAKRRKDTTPNLRKMCLQLDLTEEEYSCLYSNIRTMGFTTKARSFLFKLYAGLLYGNDRLHIFGFSESRKCKRCNHQVEDIQHMLVDCPDTRKFRVVVYSKLGKSFDRSAELLGKSDDFGLSFILLQMNRFIYQRKFLEIPLNSSEFYAQLCLEKKVEETLARKARTQQRHNRKWNNILSTGIIC